jgi:hypothetical protein
VSNRVRAGVSYRHLMPRLAAVVLACLIVIVPRLADACGVWHMQDVEKKLRVDWLINAGSIFTDKARIAAIYLDDEKGALRVVKDRKVIFDYADKKIRKYGKPVATLDDTGVTFGKKVFAIEFGDAVDYHGMSAWKLTVKLGDKLVIESDQATALCAGIHKDMVDADKKHEIRLRIAFYLAWRELGI